MKNSSGANSKQESPFHLLYQAVSAIKQLKMIQLFSNGVLWLCGVLNE